MYPAFEPSVPLSLVPAARYGHISQQLRQQQPQKLPHVFIAPRHNSRRVHPRASVTLLTGVRQPDFLTVAAIALPTLPAAAAPWAVASALLAAAALGLVLEDTQAGAALSAPLITMFATLAMSNVGILPAVSPIYSAVTAYLVPLAVPLLLFSADLRRAVTQTGKLLRAFVLGTLGTLIGTVVAWKLVPLHMSLGLVDSWKIAAALCARHIGGAVNYVATVEALGAAPAAVTAGIAADNLIVALYFLVLFVIARRVVYKSPAVAVSIDESDGGAEDAQKFIARASMGEDLSLSSNALPIRMVDVSLSVALSACLCTTGTAIASAYLPQLGAIPVITGLVVALATAFPTQLRRLCTAGSGVGIFVMQVFFAATGASGSIGSVLRTAPALFMFSAVQIAVHLAFVMLLGCGVFKWNLEELVLASNANVGGPTTAAGMAAAKRWTELIVPSLLVGVFGYAIATFLSLAIGHLVLKPSLLGLSGVSALAHT
jgi:uncharacterized membrane protein